MDGSGNGCLRSAWFMVKRCGLDRGWSSRCDPPAGGGSCRFALRLLLLSLLVLAAGLEGAPRRGRAQDTARNRARDPAHDPESRSEPWVVDGERLEGTRHAGTLIESPRITHGALVITSEQGRIAPDRDIVTLQGSVRIADTLRLATARTGIYNRFTRRLEMSGDVRGRGPEGLFTAGSLSWDRTIGHLVLRGDPSLSEPTRVLWADRIEMFSEEQTGDATGNVRILLLPDTTWVYGRAAHHDESTGRTTLTGDPRLVAPARGIEPEMEVLADTLILDEARRMGEALGSVRVRRGELRARGRSARFLMPEDRMVLHGEPVAWDPDGEIRADTMSVRTSGGDADQLRAFGSVVVRYEPREKPGETNIVVGDTLEAVLQGGAVTDMVMTGRAASLHVPAVSDLLMGSGRNFCRGSSIHVYLRDGEARRVDLVNSASGVYNYPGDSTLRALRDPELRDSMLTQEMDVADSRGGGVDTEQCDLSGPPPDPPGPELPYDPGPEGEFAPPPPLPPLLARFLETGDFHVPDSLASPLDRLLDERVAYEGDSIRFHVPEKWIRIRGNGTVRYLGNSLTSEEINFYAGRELITALGSPALSDPENTVHGEKMTYRTDTREGLVYSGRTEFDAGFYYGDRIKKLPDDALLVSNGEYTTCNDSVPHFHFHSRRMKLLVRDKAVARPVVLYIRNIPVMALPYYIFPLRTGRRSGIMMPDLEVGMGDRGRFVRNLGYYWAISDYMDARSWVDYYDRGPRIYLNAIYRYRVRYLLDGNVDASYLREKTVGGDRSMRWSLRGNHRQELWENASLTARADFTSDLTYRGEQDFGAGIDERLNRQLRSNVTFRRSWSRLSMTIGANRTEYLDEITASGLQIQQDGPSVDINLNSSALGRSPDAYGEGGRLGFLSATYLGTSWSYRNTYSRRFDGSISARQAASQNLSLSDTRSFGPYLRLRPSVSGRWAWYARDSEGRRSRFGGMLSGSMFAGSTVYGTATELLGSGLSLRHVVEPSASWSYAPEISHLTYVDEDGRRQARFPGVGGISLGSGRRSSSMTMRVSQRFHAKWTSGDEVIRKENLLTWDTSTSYDFLAEASPAGGRKRPWSSIGNSVSLRPVRFFESSVSTSHDPYTRAPTSLRANTGLRISSAFLEQIRSSDATDAADRQDDDAGLSYGEYGESDIRGSDPGHRGRELQSGTPFAWDLNLSHTYSRQRGASRPGNTLNTGLGFNPTTHWRVSGGIYFDLEEREVVSHSMSLYRDLHCWEMRFEYRSSGARSEYYFRINIKQIPDVQYQREGR